MAKRPRTFERNRAEGGRLQGVFGNLLVKRFSVRQPELFRVIKSVTAERLTPLSQAALCEIAQAVMDIEFDGLDGDFIQAGCGLGGGAVVIAHAKRRNRSLTLYDSQRTLPEHALQIRDILVGHGVSDKANVNLSLGDYGDSFFPEGPLALVHLDCPDYETTRLLLERAVPHLAPRSHLVIDDYQTQETCRRAVDDYFRGRAGFRFVRKSRLHVIRS